MTFFRNDPITQLAFSVHENKGIFAVLLGSGLSRSAGIPTGWEITLDLIRSMAMAKDVEEQSDWARWYREETGQEPNYSTLLEEIAGSPDERRAILQRYIEPNEQDREESRKLPTPAHHAIAKLVLAGYVRVVVTTNFDRLMENALREHGIEPTVVASTDALAGAEPLIHSRCYILKLHGDYKDVRILNTDQELNAYPDSYNQLLDRIFDEHGMIVCGWSGEWDYALKAAFLRSSNRRYPTYWATRGELGEGAHDLVKHRSARTIKITNADEFFQTLQQQVETIEQNQRQNPLNVKLIASIAKKYVAKAEHRIQLADLFGQETERLLDKFSGDDFSVQAQFSQDAFRTRIKRYESSIESIACMAGISGRWGDGSELGIVLDVLQTLHHQAGNNRSGQSIWLELQDYPAVLIFTAYGIGLTKAARWDALLNLFSAKLTSDRHGQQQVVSTFFLQAWNGSRNVWWQQLDGLERNITPLSSHLFDVMTQWKINSTGIDGNFELLFERFEILGSLAYFHDNDESELEKKRNQSASSHGVMLAGMPMGRVKWEHSGARILLQELEDEAYTQKLLQAGFAKGRQSFLHLFIENFKFHMQHIWSY